MRLHGISRLNDVFSTMGGNMIISPNLSLLLPISDLYQSGVMISVAVSSLSDSWNSLPIRSLSTSIYRVKAYRHIL